jgi:hypothetical protein
MNNLLNSGQVLSRNEMKKIVAGTGNIHCSNGSRQVQCHSDDLELCTDLCVAEWGDGCHGCAEFPQVYP